MSQPGWYPDPAGTPSQYRYWDGTRWSDTTSATPAGPPPTGPKRSPVPILIAAGVLVVVVAVVAAVFLLRPASDTPADGPVTSDPPAPTGSVWNETSTPDQTAGRPVDCDINLRNQLPAPQAAGGRLTVGKLSMPVPAGWLGPRHDSRMPYGRDTYGYTKSLPEKLGWASSVMIGVAEFKQFPGTEGAAHTMTQCVLTSSFYVSVQVKLTSYAAKAVTVSGHRGTQADALIEFSHPQLTTKGSKLRIVVVEIPGGAPQFFFSAVPKERADHIQVQDQSSAGLRVS